MKYSIRNWKSKSDIIKVKTIYFLVYFAQSAAVN